MTTVWTSAGPMPIYKAMAIAAALNDMEDEEDDKDD